MRTSSQRTGPQHTTKQKLTGAHFTPPDLARVVAKRLMEEIPALKKAELRVLDPSCGDGELLLAVQHYLPDETFLSMIGVEADEASLDQARRRCRPKMNVTAEFIQSDFLEMARKPYKQQSFFEHEETDASKSIPGLVDMIIANPPYVRTQHLGAKQSQELAGCFGLTGRIDLYHAFVIAMTRCLAPGGLLGIITSNRFLTTVGGEMLRSFLVHEYDILALYDLGDTKLFQAAVLPALLFGRKKSQNDRNKGHKAQFVRIYESISIKPNHANVGRPASSIYQILNSPQTGTYIVNDKLYSVAIGELDIPRSIKQPWAMTTNREQTWLQRIEANSSRRFEDISKVRVGIKTTADSVFIRSDWDTFPCDLKPELKLLRPIISQDTAQRWQPSDKIGNSREVLYTHEVKGGRRVAIDLGDHPKAAAYLEMHRDRLAGREYIRTSRRQWFEIWVPQDPSAWGLPKLVFPDISPEPRFLFNDDGSIVDGNCYWVTLFPTIAPDTLFLMLGLANTRLMTLYHDLMFQNKLYSGRRRYLTQYVQKYPLPELNSETANRIIVTAKKLALDSADDLTKKELEEEIECLAAKAFGVEPIAEDQLSGLNTAVPSYLSKKDIGIDR